MTAAFNADSVFREDLQCRVISLRYDFAAMTGYLHMPDDNCTDMRGCIKLFEAIDPRCRRIETIAGEEPDTVYVLSDDEWTAFLPD